MKRVKKENSHSLPHASFSKYLDIFLDMMAAERGAAQNTLESYSRDLQDFSKFVNRRNCSIIAHC